MEWNDDKSNFITADIRCNIQIEPTTLIPNTLHLPGNPRRIIHSLIFKLQRTANTREQTLINPWSSRGEPPPSKIATQITNPT
ncbi:hypothetical protein TcasGA2_TC008305 [Tribolium castaneum]|uniref:Uncharacterized protein n=1 Tax=Tribolium castaneum TaxID=7070 RepID=D2A106_TRICA|nr:hypothetical protein TcasGA2_TC008305 [Tribolium castaneum]